MSNIPITVSDANPCPDCLESHCLALRVDRKGRVYTRCHACGTICFRYSNLALKGLSTAWKMPLTLEEVRLAVARMQRKPAAAQTGARV